MPDEGTWFAGWRVIYNTNGRPESHHGPPTRKQRRIHGGTGETTRNTGRGHLSRSYEFEEQCNFQYIVRSMKRYRNQPDVDRSSTRGERARSPLLLPGCYRMEYRSFRAGLLRVTERLARRHLLLPWMAVQPGRRSCRLIKSIGRRHREQLRHARLAANDESPALDGPVSSSAIPGRVGGHLQPQSS
jgi:hypothetical protein